MTTFAYSGGALNNLVGNTPGANVSNLVTLLNDLKNFLNATNLDATNLADIPEGLLALALQQKLGLNDGGQIGRGKSIIATTGTRTNVAYGALSDAADQVSNVVLPTDGLLCVAYQALWQESIDGTASAAIFVGANQLRTQVVGVPGPGTQAALCAGNAGIMTPLATGPAGLMGRVGVAAAAATSDVTTGQLITYDQGVPGGPCFIFAAAGTYNVSIQFQSSSGTVTAKERKLWVWTIGF